MTGSWCIKGQGCLLAILTAGFLLGPGVGALRADAGSTCDNSIDSLGSAVYANVLARIDMWVERRLDPEPKFQFRAHDFLSGISERLALSPHDERAILYTQFENGLCAHVVDETGLIASAWRPGQDAAMLRLALQDLRVALRVETRMIVRRATPRLPTPDDQDTGMPVRSARPLDETEVEAGESLFIPETPAIAAKEPAAHLAGMLMLDELLPHLAGGDEIMIVPTHDIGTVPFALLPLGDGAMIDLAPLTIVPSVHDLAGVGFSSQDEVSFAMDPIGFTAGWDGALIVGDPSTENDPDWKFPPLPGARAEAKSAAAALGVTHPLLGAEATVGAVTTALEAEPGLVYLAAHGIATSESALMNSFIALADGRLIANDVLRMNLSSKPLVVLSACQSGLGQSHSGGTIGLSRSFIIAGASAVISSLWNVDDAATVSLMGDFLDGTARDRPAVALWKATLTARALYPDDPALWAAFVHFGSVSVFVDG